MGRLKGGTAWNDICDDLTSLWPSLLEPLKPNFFILPFFSARQENLFQWNHLSMAVHDEMHPRVSSKPFTMKDNIVFYLPYSQQSTLFGGMLKVF